MSSASPRQRDGHPSRRPPRGIAPAAWLWTAFVSLAVMCMTGCERRSTAPEKGAARPLGAGSGSAPARPAPYAQPSASVLTPRAEPQPSFAALARHADPAVVFVETEQAMFGTGRRIVGEGLGSGFVFDPSGLILTNYHVIARATRIDVVFGKHRKLRAEVVGADPPTDIAVLEVDAKDLPHLAFGDSDSLRVGDWVVAIGNPFGLSHTVSAGILSAKGRTSKDVQGLDPSGYYDFLQTDASINPGNSGGPLLDLSGRVVGINSAIKPQANNIGFAIPVNMVRELLPSLLEYGKVRRSAIGVVVASVKEQDQKRLKLESRIGSLVTRVIPGGPGDKAGLKVDDVILAFGDVEGAGPHRLRWLASIAGVGETVKLKVARGAKVFDLAVALGELPEPAEKQDFERFLVP